MIGNAPIIAEGRPNQLDPSPTSAFISRLPTSPIKVDGYNLIVELESPAEGVPFQKWLSIDEIITVALAGMKP